METQIKDIENIEKELVGNLVFPNSEVLKSTEQIKFRKRMLDTGMKLGNNHRRKVKIIFEDVFGLKMVETTIWASTKDNISLKGGVVIPVQRIHSMEIY